MSILTPRATGLRQPAEWASHEAVWLAWPSHGDLWLDKLAAAQAEFVELCRIIHANGRGERLEVLVPTEQDQATAEKALAAFQPRRHLIPFGDIWLRDTAPVFVTGAAGEVAAVRFAFNGWGGKYLLEHDEHVSAAVAAAAVRNSFTFDLVMEGGSLDVDGEGTCLTTKQCLLNPNRNRDLHPDQIEEQLKEALGIDAFVWINQGLLNDHTDGHIDTIARFVKPGVVVCMEAREANDPNAAVLDAIASELAAARDAKGRPLEVIRIPSPGRIVDGNGRVMPASYVNFYIGNQSVAVPNYGSKWDAEATQAIAALFPGRETVGASCRAILEGGGAFHCITQQQPSGSAA
jgi:agmatine deiminase